MDQANSRTRTPGHVPLLTVPRRGDLFATGAYLGLDTVLDRMYVDHGGTASTTTFDTFSSAIAVRGKGFVKPFRKGPTTAIDSARAINGVRLD